MLTQFHIFVLIIALKIIFYNRIDLNSNDDDDDEPWGFYILILAISLTVMWVIAGWLVDPLNLIIFGESTIK